MTAIMTPRQEKKLFSQRGTTKETKPKKSKYKNTKTEVDGILFDSKREASRYKILRVWQKNGIVSGLELQKEFVLVPSQKLGNPRKRKDGKFQRTEQAVIYKADFCYTHIETGNYVVEDSKGAKTDDYIIKRKLMKLVHGIEVVEV